MAFKAKDCNRTIGLFVLAGLLVGFFLSFVLVRDATSTATSSVSGSNKASPRGKQKQSRVSPPKSIGCKLFDIGKALEDDKFTSHSFGTLYCEMLNPIRIELNRQIRMLEIGFGCGHHNHGVSARVWKQFFSPPSGPGVRLYEVDYGPHVPHEVCVKEFKKKYPNIVEEVFLGDQSNKTFVREVIKKSGGSFDVIVDDGGHMYNHQKPSFEVLWPELRPGGVYFIEDLELSHSEDGMMIKEILGWMHQLASGEKGLEKKLMSWPSTIPKDMISVDCHKEICAFRKQYENDADIS